MTGNTNEKNAVFFYVENQTKIVKSERGMGKAQGFWGIHLYSEIIFRYNEMRYTKMKRADCRFIRQKIGGILVNREKIIVIDFGGQYNQLVARRVRECNVLL